MRLKELVEAANRGDEQARKRVMLKYHSTRDRATGQIRVLTMREKIEIERQIFGRATVDG